MRWAETHPLPVPYPVSYAEDVWVCGPVLHEQQSQAFKWRRRERPGAWVQSGRQAELWYSLEMHGGRE